MSRSTETTRTLKRVLFIFDPIYLVICIGIIYFIINEYYLVNFRLFLGDTFLAFPVVLGFLVIFTLCFTIAGFWGKLKRKYRFLVWFAVSFGVAILLETVLIYYSYDIKSSLDLDIKHRMRVNIGEEVESVRTDWNLLQSKLQCCGINGPKDWCNSSAVCEVPTSCCTNSSHCVYPSSPLLVYQRGCLQTLRRIAQRDSVYITGITFGLIVFQIFGMILGFCLAFAFWKIDVVYKISKSDLPSTSRNLKFTV